MFTKRDRNKNRIVRHQRVRNKISGTPESPRLCVYRSLNHIYAQIVDDVAGKTLASASTVEQSIADQVKELDKKSAAKVVGKMIAERGVAAGIKSVVFDRWLHLHRPCGRSGRRRS